MGVDIDNDRVRQLAQVSRLKLTEDEVETYQAQLSSILTTISEVKTMDTEGVEPMLYPRVLGNVMRPDKAGGLDAPGTGSGQWSRGEGRNVSSPTHPRRRIGGVSDVSIYYDGP